MMSGTVIIDYNPVTNQESIFDVGSNLPSLDDLIFDSIRRGNHRLGEITKDLFGSSKRSSERNRLQRHLASMVKYQELTFTVTPDPRFSTRPLTRYYEVIE